MRRLGLCAEGGAERFIDDGDNTYGGKVVTNPSGGLLSKGHPLGATGLAQCYELTQQLRGTAAARRSRARGSGCSTTSGSAAPASSRSTNAPEACHGRSIRRRARVHAGHRACRAGRLRFFLETLGESNPRLSRCSRRAGCRLCRAAGAADLSVLPRNDGRRTEPFEFLNALGIDLARVLHGEQRFAYPPPSWSATR